VIHGFSGDPCSILQPPLFLLVTCFFPFLITLIVASQPFSSSSWAFETINMGYTIGNIYVITTVAVIGGALFGFDISSMSAM